MAKYVLGLDMGITSVGWGLIDAETGTIIDKGVRLFKEEKAADNETRRDKRGSRRLKRRRQQRIIELKKLLKRENILSSDYKPLNNVYELRCKGLKEKLTNDELVTVILNIAKKRGSSLDVVEDDEKLAKEKEDGSKANLTKNESYLLAENLNVCERQLQELNEYGKVRGTENIYKSTSYQKELENILSNQELDEAVKKEIVKIIFRKRDFNDGPGGENSPTIYGKFVPQPNGEIVPFNSMIEKMRGKCSVYPEEARASKMSYTADLFNLLNDLNNLTIDREDEEYVTEEEKEIIINDYIIEKGKITIKELCNKVLGVDEIKISGFRVKDDKPIITEFNGYQKILKALNKEILPSDVVDNIIDILTENKEIETRKKRIRDLNIETLNEEKIESLAKISGIKEYHSLSYKAMKEMIPELLSTNDNQMQILTRMNLLKNNRQNLANRATIPSYSDQIYSPVAKRVHNETIKVINAVIKRYGELDSIVIEMARDRNVDEAKKRIADAQKNGLRLNEEAKELIRNETVGYDAERAIKKPQLVQKIRLYKEQDGRCLYSGKPIDLQRLISDPTAYEIDHIIPISISLNDSMSNKVLVYRSENQNKLNRTPFQYLSSGDSSGWSYKEFTAFVLKLYSDKRISKNKLQNLLDQRDISKEEVRKKFIERNLVDTRYASRVVLNLLQDYFKVNNKKTKVFTIRGQITSQFRRNRKLDKSRDTFYHHIVDALIVAYFRKFNYINELMQYGFKYLERIDDETGEVVRVEQRLFDSKDDNFTTQLRELNKIDSYDETIKISHKVDRKPNRKFTDETIYSVKQLDGEDWRISKYKNIYGEDKEGKKFADEIKKNLNNEEKLDKFLMRREDPITFQLLVDIVKNTTCDAKENPFKKYCEENGLDAIRKRSKKGLGPKITSIRYYNEKLGNHLDISQKYSNISTNKKVVLLQVSPFRTDFYKDSNGLYKFITIRYIHFNMNKNGMYIPKETYQKLKEDKKIDDSFEFQFSLYRNEYLKIEKANDKTNDCQIYRFVGTNDDITNRIEVKPIYRDKLEEKSQIKITIGKEITNITKYDVDVLGNRFAKKRDKCLQLEF